MDYEKMFPLAVENDEMYLLKYKMLKDLIAVKLEGKLTYLPFPLVNEVLVEKRKM
jgi:hypothetical protein